MTETLVLAWMSAPAVRRWSLPAAAEASSGHASALRAGRRRGQVGWSRTRDSIRTAIAAATRDLLARLGRRRLGRSRASCSRPRCSACSPWTPRVSRSGRCSVGSTSGRPPRRRPLPVGSTADAAVRRRRQHRSRPRTSCPGSTGCGRSTRRLDTDRWLLDCKETVLAWLTGRAVTDRAGASAYRLTDPASLRLGCLLVRVAGRAARAPATRDRSSDVRGRRLARSRRDRRSACPAGLPVFVGAGDVPASQLGSGALGAGDTHLSLGTAIYLGIHADRPLTDPGRRLGVLGHAMPDAWILWLEIATGGAALWLDPHAPSAIRSDWMCRSTTRSWIEQLVTSVEGDTDDLLFAPWLSGERVPLFDDDARGAFVGLALHHGRAHLMRAVMEGVAYQIRWAYEYGLAYGLQAGLHPSGRRWRHGQRLAAHHRGHPRPTHRGARCAPGCRGTGSRGDGLRGARGVAIAGAVDEHVRVARIIEPDVDRGRPLR